MSRGPGLAFASLRSRLTLWYGALLALCLIAYSAAAGAFFTRHVSYELDRRLHEDVELATRALIVDHEGSVGWAGGFAPKEIHEEEGGGHWLEVWSPGGERLLSASTIAPLDLGSAPLDLGSAPRGHEAPRTLSLPVGPVRVMTEPVVVEGSRLLIRAAVRETAARSQLAVLWSELLGLSVVVLMLGGLGGLVIAHRALGPLARMAERARRITADHLHERLPEEASSSELVKLREAFNETLARLERSFDQLKRFTADASHELRTPLTALRSVGEVGLRGARTVEDYREVIGSMLEEVDRLARLADELLTLARAEAGEARLRLEPIDLAALAREVVEYLSVLAEERSQSIELEPADPVTAQADRTVLRQALVNLVDNAIKYSPERSRVRIRVGRDGGESFVAVADSGPGMAPEHREKIFERFYRIDKSRSRELGGTGLGLSLVKWAAEAHGGRVELETAEGRGSTFRLVLPM